MDIKNAIEKVIRLKDLTEEETISIFGEIMEGNISPAQIGAFLSGLRMKGESVSEITGAARSMRNKAIKISLPEEILKEGLLDTCGTGGTGKDTFNISTTVSFVVAGLGVKVAKHGNRAASGRSGSADILEALGVKIDVSPEVTAKCIREIGIGFLYAPIFHSAMKYAALPRKEIGIRTIFNLIGPLSNPAGATCQVMGVYDRDLTEKIAEVLGNLGVKRAYVVHGEDGFDEVTITGKTKVSELKNNKVVSYKIAPKDFGLKVSCGDDIAGGRNAEENAKITRSVLSGKKGAALDIVLMNAAVAFMAAGRIEKMKEGTAMALNSVTSGRALEKLEELIKLTNEG